jgi:hypothetical protein
MARAMPVGITQGGRFSVILKVITESHADPLKPKRALYREE